MTIILDDNSSEELDFFSKKLNISKEKIISQALEDYFDKVSKEIVEKEVEDYNKDTKLSFNEFWDDVDI
jgi:predicted transcriptional regulator